MSFPGKVLKQIYLSEADKSDILFGIEQDVDFIACSFVSCKQDLDDVRTFLDEHTPDDNISLIAKIENQHGVDNIDEICQACDGIMIGRGDMGVEIAFEELPQIQKHLITKCRLLGKRVITATEMLESMIYNPRPTRAEISDVANAVYDGTSAIMLSGETAAGKYPVLAVETMAKIAETTERNINYKKRFFNTEFDIENSVDAVSHATCSMGINLNAKAIVVCSLSGRTARMVSRFRPPVDIIGICIDQKSVRKLSLSWGVTPVLGEPVPTTDVLFYSAYKTAKNIFNLKKGDQIVITGGQINGKSGNTNLLKVDTI
jgi:pyruvate kinase